MPPIFRYFRYGVADVAARATVTLRYDAIMLADMI